MQKLSMVQTKLARQAKKHNRKKERKLLQKHKNCLDKW